MKTLEKCTMSLKCYLLSVLGLFWSVIHLSVSTPDQVGNFPIEFAFSLIHWVVLSFEANLPSTIPISVRDLGTCTELSQIISIEREQIIPNNVPRPCTEQTWKNFQSQLLNVSLYLCSSMASCLVPVCLWVDHRVYINPWLPSLWASLCA